MHLLEPEIRLDILDSENLESQIIDKFKELNPSKFNPVIYDIMRALQIDKQEDESSNTFQDRLHNETKKLLGL